MNLISKQRRTIEEIDLAQSNLNVVLMLRNHIEILKKLNAKETLLAKKEQEVLQKYYAAAIALISAANYTGAISNTQFKTAPEYLEHLKSLHSHKEYKPK